MMPTKVGANKNVTPHPLPSITHVSDTLQYNDNAKLDRSGKDHPYGIALTEEIIQSLTKKP
jgi:hypothetical protein